MPPERGPKTGRCDSREDFAPCIYAGTVNLEDWRSAALGRIVVDSRDNLGAPFSAHCELSEMGKAVADCWESIPRFYPQIKIIGKQVMPEHFHGLLWVKERMPCHLGQVIKGFKTGCNKAARALGVVLGTTVSSPTRHGKGLWKEGFQDTILWREGQLENMIAYLQANPIRRALKAANPQLFHQVIDLEVDGLHFSALGNRHLLDRPLVQVQCSRRDFTYERVSDAGGGMKIAKDADGEPRVAFSSATFEDRLASLLAVAEHGSVLLSPCVSDGERQIARQALVRGLPLIAMRNMGFGKLEKPSGRLFDACAAGRYLMLAPAAWPYTAAKKEMTRFDAVAMNRLCQWLAREGAAEINYRGMRPADIDALARAAAQATTSLAPFDAEQNTLRCRIGRC